MCRHTFVDDYLGVNADDIRRTGKLIELKYTPRLARHSRGRRAVGRVADGDIAFEHPVTESAQTTVALPGIVLQCQLKYARKVVHCLPIDGPVRRR